MQNRTDFAMLISDENGAVRLTAFGIGFINSKGPDRIDRTFEIDKVCDPEITGIAA